MKKIAFFTPEDAAYGFRLAGFTQCVCDEQTFDRVFTDLIKDADYGMLVIDERLVSEEVEQKIRGIQESWPGVIVILPAPDAKEGKALNYAERLLRRAIGYQVTMQG